MTALRQQRSVEVKHVTFNHGVEGSSPSALTKKSPLPQSLFEYIEVLDWLFAILDHD
jgi:hypothetical protein